MSEQNPPSGPPTPPPGEPVPGEPGAHEPVAGEPVPGEPVAGEPVPGEPVAHDPGVGEPVAGATAAYGTTPPPPPPARRSRRTPLIIGVAVLLVLILVGAAVAVIVNVTGSDKHSIAIPSTAGGMKRDTATEGQLKTQLNAAEQQFKSQAKSVSYVKSGVYKQADSNRGPQGALVFLGAKLSKVQSPAKFVDAFGKQAGSNGFKIDKIAAGDGGGKAVCASQATGQKVAICAWATTDSMGELIPTVPGWDSAKLGKVMIALRKDVEKTE